MEYVFSWTKMPFRYWSETKIEVKGKKFFLINVAYKHFNMQSLLKTYIASEIETIEGQKSKF